MSDPGYNEVTIKVTADNDTGKTRDEVEADWAAMKDIAVKIHAQLADGDEFLADVKALSTAGSDHAVHIPVHLSNGDEFLADVRALVTAAGDTSIKIPVTVKPPVVPRPRKAPDPVDVPTRAENPIDAAWRAKVAASVRALSKDFLKVPVTADTEGLRTKLTGSLAELRDISKVKLTMEPEDAAELKAGVDARIAQIRAEIDVPIRAQADAAKLRADMDKAVAKATAGEGGVKVPVDVDTTKAQASTRDGMRLVTKLIIAGVAAGAAPAGGLLAAGLDAGFIGLALLANKSNAEVVKSYKTMSATVVAEVRGASASTVPFIAQSAASMEKTVGELRDELSDSFRAAGPDLRTLTAGVDQFALNAMPGMTDSLRNSQPVIQGTASLISSLGESVGDSFGTMSTRAGAYGVAVQDLGPLTSSVLHGIFTLTNQLADVWAQDGQRIDSTVEGLVGTVTGLAGGALPGLTNELGSVLTVAGGVLTVLRPMSPLLGVLASDVVPFVAAWKGFSTVQGLVDRTGQRLEQFGKTADGALGSAATQVGKFSQTASGAFGVGAAGIIAGITIYSSVMGDATKQESQLQQQTLSLTSALEDSGGKIDATVNKALVSLAQNIDDSSRGFTLLGIRFGGSAQTISQDLDQAGISVNDFVSAVEQGGAPLGKLQSMLEDERWNAPSNATKEAAQALLEALPGIVSSYGTAKTNAQQLGNATGQTADQMRTLNQVVAGTKAATADMISPAAASNAYQLATAQQTLADKTATADAKISAFQLDLKLLSEGGMEAANDEISKFYGNLDTLGSSLSSDKGKLDITNGQLDLTSQKGRDVFSALESARDAMAGYVQNATDANTPQAQINQHLQDMYTTLEQKLIPAFGGNKKAVDALLTSMGLIPTNVETQYKDNSGQAKQNANDLGGAVRKVPQSWMTEFGSNAGSFITQAGKAATAVTKVPGKWDTFLHADDGVTGVVRGAQAAINGLHGRTITISAALAGVNAISSEINHLFGHAAGGPVSGLATMNKGEELVRLPNGSIVVPAANTHAMLSGASAPAAPSGPLRLEVGSGGDGQLGAMLRYLFQTGVVRLRTADGRQVIAA